MSGSGRWFRRVAGAAEGWLPLVALAGSAWVFVAMAGGEGPATPPAAPTAAAPAAACTPAPQGRLPAACETAPRAHAARTPVSVSR